MNFSISSCHQFCSSLLCLRLAIILLTAQMLMKTPLPNATMPCIQTVLQTPRYAEIREEIGNAHADCSSPASLSSPNIFGDPSCSCFTATSFPFFSSSLESNWPNSSQLMLFMVAGSSYN